MLTVKKEEYIRSKISEKKLTSRYINNWLTTLGINIPFCDNIDINELEEFVSNNQDYLKHRLSSTRDNLHILVDKGHFRIEG